VDVTEGGGGEGDEQQWVLRDLLGHGLSAHETGADHRERVPGVDAGAGGAHVASADENDPTTSPVEVSTVVLCPVSRTGLAQ
jgi:hypothetical protein